MSVTTSTIVVFAYLSVLAASLFGWVMNIFTIFSGFDAMGTGEAIVRIVGIPVGIIGAVLGYL